MKSPKAHAIESLNGFIKERRKGSLAAKMPKPKAPPAPAQATPASDHDEDDLMEALSKK